jgi:hypothetical protein
MRCKMRIVYKVLALKCRMICEGCVRKFAIDCSACSTRAAPGTAWQDADVRGIFRERLSGLKVDADD